MQKKALIVEDNRSVAEVEAEVLRAVGVSPEIVNSGEEAVGKLMAVQFDLVILNWHLAGKMTGLDVFTWLKESIHPMPAVIFAIGESAEELVGTGCPVLQKPVSAEELRETIQKVL